MLRPFISSEAGSQPTALTRSLLASAARIGSIALCSAVLLAGPAFAQGRYSEIGKRVSPAVVKLESYDGQGQLMGMGTGFLVNPSGLIVTNYHVIREAYQMKVTAVGGDVYGVDGVVVFDPDKDFAIRKVTAFGLPVVELGNSNQVDILEEV